MGRPRKGTAYEKPAGSGVWWVSLTLRTINPTTGKANRWTDRIPAKPDGSAITPLDADAFRAELARRYESREWDPEAPVPEALSPPRPMTVYEYCETWAKGVSTWSSKQYQWVIEHWVRPAPIGAVALAEVSRVHVVAWVAWLNRQPSRFGGTIAARTVRQAYAVLKRALEQAEFEGITPARPFDGLPRRTLPPKLDKVPGARQRWRFLRDEVELLISHPEIPPHRRLLWALLFLTGTRIGEAIVLKWSDYDPKTAPLGCLLVSQSWHRLTKVVKGTKTGAVKEVPVHPVLAAMLAEWKLGGWHRRHGRKPEGSDMILSSLINTPLEPGYVAVCFKRDCAMVGLRVRKLHATRHTLISMAGDAGARRDVIKWLTHAAPETDEFGKYFKPLWETLCGELAKIPVVRRDPDRMLPLFAVVGSDVRSEAVGEAGSSAGSTETLPARSATDSATGPREPAQIPTKSAVIMEAIVIR